MTELAEIAMFIRLNWQLLVAIILMIALAIWLIPPAVKSESESMSQLLQEDYKIVQANIKHAMEGAKKQSDKKYGDAIGQESESKIKAPDDWPKGGLL